LELQELSARQRADAADAQLALVRAQLDAVSKRNSGLEEAFSEVSRLNLDQQRTEMQLRDQLDTSIPKEQFDKANSRIHVRQHRSKNVS
jgi:hypothetical protein